MRYPSVIWIFLILGLCVLGLCGCATSENVFVSMKHYTQGEYYLQNNDYERCIAQFEPKTAKHPDDAKAHFYLGRCRLALEKNKSALADMKKAVSLNPGNPDYQFWLGLAYAANGQSAGERRSYLDALAIDPKHVQTLVYLGHNRFEARRYRDALGYYNRALQIAPAIPTALYNRALALRRLERTPEEINAWLTYLAAYPDGAFARQATGYLNRHGRFDYRNHIIGKRTLPLAGIQFNPSSAKLRSESLPALKTLARVTAQNQELVLHIVAYQKNNLRLAKARARSVKKDMLDREPRIAGARIKVSWFDQPESVKIGRRTHRLDSSVNFIGISQKKP